MSLIIASVCQKDTNKRALHLNEVLYLLFLRRLTVELSCFFTSFSFGEGVSSFLFTSATTMSTKIISSLSNNDLVEQPVLGAIGSNSTADAVKTKVAPATVSQLLKPKKRMTARDYHQFLLRRKVKSSRKQL